MNPLIQAFLDLQFVDRQILQLKRKATSDSEQITQEKIAYKKLEKSLEGTKEVLKKTKAEHDIKKLDLATAIEKREKTVEKLQKITNNKEYKAIEKESRTYKEEVDALTRYSIASDENIRRLEKSLSTGEEELKQKKNLIKELLLKNKSEKDVFEKQIDELKTARANYENKVKALEDVSEKDHSLLENYNKLTNLPNGDIIVLMEGDTCCGCFMRVNTQLASKIKSQKIIGLCTSCSRLLYTES